MDPSIIGGVVTAACGGIAAVIGSLALFRKASVPFSAAVSALRSLWDWVEFEHLEEKVPSRIRKQVETVLDYEVDAKKGDDNNVASI